MGRVTHHARWMRDATPFAGMALLGLLSAGAPAEVWVRPAWIASAALTALAGALLLIRPVRTRIPYSPHVAAAAYLGAVALLRSTPPRPAAATA